MNPDINIIGITHQVSLAPPVNNTSTRFIEIYIEIIEIIDMPIAVLNASTNSICRDKIKVSNMIDVKRPLMIAKIIISIVAHGICVYWKKAIVRKSPIEQPNKHHKVFLDAFFQECSQLQLIDKFSATLIISVYNRIFKIEK